MAGIQGLALDPYGQQAQNAGQQLGQGVDTVAQRYKAEQEANAPVHPLADFALKMRALQQEFPEHSPEELGKILQLRESGHPSFAPPAQPQQPQQASQPQPQAQSPQAAPPVQVQQPQAPAPQGPAPMAAAPAPVAGQELPAAPAVQLSQAAPAAPAPGHQLADVAASVKQVGPSLAAGTPQPGAQLPPVTGTKIAQPASTGGLDSLLAQVSTPSAAQASTPSPNDAPPKKPIILSDEQKRMFNTPIRNKDFAQVEKAVSGRASDKSAEAQAKMALQAQADAAKLERQKLAIQDRLIREKYRTEAEAAAKETLSDVKLTMQEKQFAIDIFKQQQQLEAELMKIRAAAESKGVSDNNELRLKLLDLAAQMQIKSADLSVKLASAFGANEEMRERGMRATYAIDSQLAAISGALNEVLKDVGQRNLVPGAPQYAPDIVTPGKDKLFGKEPDTVEPGPLQDPEAAQGIADRQVVIAKKPESAKKKPAGGGPQPKTKVVKVTGPNGERFELPPNDSRIPKLKTLKGFTVTEE